MPKSTLLRRRRPGRVRPPRRPAPGELTAREALAARLRAAGCVFAEDEADRLLGAGASPAGLEELVLRRTRGEPLEHVLGEAAFWGLRVSVQPGVFVPRPRSEALVEEAIGLTRPGAIMVDLCCGTGALGLAVASTVDDVELHATDLEPVAVECARRNLAGAGAVHEGDLYAALPASLRGRVDVILANAPYVPTAELRLLPREAWEHEPHAALDGGPDGLAVHRRIAAGARAWLSPKGRLLIETSQPQSPKAEALMAEHGLSSHTKLDDGLDVAVLIASQPQT